VNEKPIIQRTTASQGETEQLGAGLATQLRGGDVVTLEGPLGAGKTCFVRGVARGLDLDPKQVSSPTFVITQEYARESSLTLVHMDAYRLHGVEELETVGWEELVSSPSVIIAVEWPSRIRPALRGLRCIDVTIEPTSQSNRSITISVPQDIARTVETLP
jgi:tRNA threonylcarbamoyladenosine biosynthesis protein TsaE